MTFVPIYTLKHGDSPSLQQIADGLRSTKASVCRAINRLERDGLLVRLPASSGRKRTIVLPDEQAKAIALLQSLGWEVNGATRELTPPAGTHRKLPVIAV